MSKINLQATRRKNHHGRNGTVDRELARAELCTVATAVEVGNGRLSPTIEKLIRFAEDSYLDLTLRKIAVDLRSMRDSGEVIDKERVGERTGEMLFILEKFPGASLPPDLAEIEAQKVMAAFRLRRLKSVSGDMLAALESSPDKADSILDTTIASLTHLRQSANGESLIDRLAARAYDPNAHLKRPESRYSIGKVSIATPGNITVIFAPAKTGKSAAKGAMVTSIFACEGADCLGFNSQNPHGHAVIDLDTEQSQFDHGEINRTIAKRAGRPLPAWFKSYCLTGWTANEIRRAIPVLLEHRKKDFGGIHSLFLDGVADAVNDVNDAAESNGFVAELHALAIQFDCTIICIIHLNPGNEFKTRGHLGSQLERKAETNLRLEKSDEIITLWADKNRHASIPKKTGPRFAWNPEAGMHTSIESAADAKEDLEFQELSKLFQNAFSTRPAMSFSDLRTTIKTSLMVSEPTAERRITKAITLGIVKKTFAGLYEIRT